MHAPTHRTRQLLRPLFLMNALNRFDVTARVRGGGNSGQVGAVQLGLARAIENYYPEARLALKQERLLRRDPREVERKKPGRMKARRKFQWVKR